ncbi:Transposase DDE domain-containing protein, partial [Collimonas sp. OK607]
KETVERSFADAKQLHGHRYAKMRGLRKLAEQCLLGAACQNMKKIALLLARLLASLNVHFDRAYVFMCHFLLYGAFFCRLPVFLEARPNSNHKK